MKIIVGGGIILLGGGIGGFDGYYDMIDCQQYIELCKVCDYFLNDNIDYATLERGQYSMANKYIDYMYPYNVGKLNPEYYLDFTEMMQEYTKYDHEGMYSLLYSDRYSDTGIPKFKFY